MEDGERERRSDGKAFVNPQRCMETAINRLVFSHSLGRVQNETTFSLDIREVLVTRGYCIDRVQTVGRQE